MPEDGRSSRAVAAVVLTVSVPVAVPLAATVTEVPEQVGASEIAGTTVQPRATVPAKPFSDVTVMVEVAETPACPEAGDSAPAANAKLAGAPLAENFATNASASPPLPKVPWRAETAGKYVETVLPATEILPLPSNAIHANDPPPVVALFSLRDPPRYVEKIIELPPAPISVTKASFDPPILGWVGPMPGKFVEAVTPVTYA